MSHSAPLSSSTNPEGALTPQLLLVHASTVCSIACMVSPLQWTQNVLFPIAGIACGFLFGLFSPFKDFRNFNLTGANELNGLEKEVILETGFWTSVELTTGEKVVPDYGRGLIFKWLDRRNWLQYFHNLTSVLSLYKSHPIIRMEELKILVQVCLDVSSERSRLCRLHFMT